MSGGQLCLPTEIFQVKTVMIGNEDRVADDMAPPAAKDSGNQDAEVGIYAVVPTLARLTGWQKSPQGARAASHHNGQRASKPQEPDEGSPATMPNGTHRLSRAHGRASCPDMRAPSGLRQWMHITVAGFFAILAGLCGLRAANAAPGRHGSGLFAALSEERARLAADGISFSGFLQGDGSHVFSGGLPHALGFDAQSLIDVSLTLNTGKLFGWQGGTLFLDAQSHSGQSVVPNQVPALADPDNMDAGPQTSLDRAWFQQSLFAHTLKLRLGLMYVDDPLKPASPGVQAGVRASWAMR